MAFSGAPRLGRAAWRALGEEKRLIVSRHFVSGKAIVDELQRFIG